MTKADRTMPAPTDPVQAACDLLLRAEDEHAWRGKRIAEALAILADEGEQLPPAGVEPIAATLSRHVHGLSQAVERARALLTATRADADPRQLLDADPDDLSLGEMRRAAPLSANDVSRGGSAASRAAGASAGTLGPPHPEHGGTIPMTEADNTMAEALDAVQPDAAAGAPAALSLAALAAALGDMEPAEDLEDMGAEHCRRQAVLRAIAPLFPVTSAGDAAMAVSAAAGLLSDAVDSYCTPEESARKIRDARKVLARLGCWIDDELGAPPLYSAFLAADLDA